MPAVEPSGCPLEGNTDLIGIGIRIGVYFFMFSSLLAKALPSRHSGHLQSSAICLIYAEFIVLARETILRRIQGLEVAAFMWMMFPQFSFVQSFDSLAANFGKNYLTIVAVTAFTFYYAWFWYHGLDTLPRTSCADEYSWFFAKVSIYHWFRTFAQVLWTLLCIIWGSIFLFFTFGYFILKKELPRGYHIPISNVQLATLLPIGIAACEMTVKWNGIMGVNSLRPMGQLVPFILGLGQLVDVIYRTSTLKSEDPEGGRDSHDDDVLDDSICPHSGAGNVEDIEIEAHNYNRE